MIEPLASADIPAMIAHLIRNHATEADATSPSPPRDPGELERRLTNASPLGTPGGQLWLALRLDGDIRGHLSLRAGPLASEAHRAELGMAIERPYRRHGWGQRLLDTGIARARSHGLAWIELGVFTDNHAAHALYVRNGFVETGVTPDRFRLDGRSVDARAMVLRL